MASTNYFSNLKQKSVFTDPGRYYNLSRDLWTQIRIPAGGTLVAGTYKLFDPNFMTANAWGSGVGNAAVSGVDYPVWYKYTGGNSTMPRGYMFLAKTLSLAVNPFSNATPPVLSMSFSQDLLHFLYADAYIEIKPEGKDIDLRIPLHQLSTYASDVFTTDAATTAAATLFTSSLTHIVNNKWGGKYPLFDEKVGQEGIMFEDESIIEVNLVVQKAFPVLTGELKIKPWLEGRYYRPI